MTNCTTRSCGEGEAQSGKIASAPWKETLKFRCSERSFEAIRDHHINTNFMAPKRNSIIQCDVLHGIQIVTGAILNIKCYINVEQKNIFF